jgi:trans-2-enoyl-CoA reductase
MLRDFVELQPGDFVVQNAGNSAVGRAAIQIAQASGWRTISLVRRASLIDELKALGADFVFLDDEDAPPRIELAAGGAPIRLALNAVGGESALRLANALASGGTIVTYGAMSRQPLRIPNGLLIFKDLRFRGFWITPRRQRATREENTAMFDELFALARRGILRQPAERVYPLDSVHEAIEHAGRSGRAGKILFGFATSALA